MSLETMLKKLTATSWLPLPAGSYLTNSEGREGTLNLAWAILGKDESVVDTMFTDPKKLAVWYFAMYVGTAKFKGGTVNDYLTILNYQEFGKVVQLNPQVFGIYMPMEVWAEVFN